MRLGWFALVCVLLLSGCMAPDVAPAALTTSASVGERPIVIALIDSGTTPYYPVFAVPDDSFIEAAIPAPFQQVTIPLDPGPDALTRDSEVWKSLDTGVLYHFAGTRLLGIGLREENRFENVRDSSFHGVATSFLAAREAPNAIIVSIQVGIGFCERQECTVVPEAAEAMEWAAAQGWIDIISVSLGTPGNLPDNPEIYPQAARYLAASKAAAARGKLVVDASGNHIAPPIQNYFNGPPWVIAVGGIEPAAKGESGLSGKTVDVVANFTDYAPMYGRGDMAWRSGTSFATPIVAGTLANALGKIRAADPARVVSTQELRDALNASATYFGPTDWDPTPPGRQPIQDELVTTASAPILVQPQMGWGYVDASLADEIARRVLEQDFSISGKEQAMLFQPAWQQARERFWAAYG